ncbi:TraB/GumN family protein [Arachidicoccus sp.]|uniref:TraB/GumN family protein n=1 Tax=Arachidicoccus sp. TaxID=1872624 RepID=UPI003D20D68B
MLYFQKDSTIQSILSKDQFDSLVNYINRQTKDNQEILHNLIKMKPQLLMIAIQLIQGSPTQVEDTTSNYIGMDEFLLNYAKENGLKTQGLEGPKERSTALLNTVTTPKAIDRIFEEIKESNTASSILSRNDNLIDKDSLDFVQLNINYDFQYKVKSIMNDYGGVIARNKLWISRLPQLIKAQSCFIVVGLDHLKYNFGLIKQLRKLGYKVTPVSMN